jgi:hypothetical protein
MHMERKAAESLRAETRRYPLATGWLILPFADLPPALQKPFAFAK